MPESSLFKSRVISLLCALLDALSISLLKHLLFTLPHQNICPCVKSVQNISSVLFYYLLILKILLFLSLLSVQPYCPVPLDRTYICFCGCPRNMTGQISMLCFLKNMQNTFWWWCFLSTAHDKTTWFLISVDEMHEDLRALFLYCGQRHLRSSRYWT